jgi:hypothetical protein
LRILKRTKRKIQDVLGEDQFKFRKGTRDETEMLRIIQGGSNMTRTNCDLFTHK